MHFSHDACADLTFSFSFETSPIRTISSADPSAAYYKASLFSDFIEGQGARDGGAGGGGLPKPGAVVFEERKPDWLEAKAGK